MLASDTHLKDPDLARSPADPAGNPFEEALKSLERQRLVLTENLSRYLSTEDGEVLSQWNPEAFSQEVLTRLRPAIVLLAPATRAYNAACQLGDRGRASVAFILNTAELERAQTAFAPYGALLVPALGAYAHGLIGASLDYNRGGDYDEQAFYLKDYQPLPPALVSGETVRLTAPPVDEIFPQLASRSLKDEPYWARVKAYEQWIEPLNRDRRREGVLQVGGWPEWVQYGKPDHFLAQSNLGIGDAGSLYVYLDGATLSADIQMY